MRGDFLPVLDYDEEDIFIQSASILRYEYQKAGKGAPFNIAASVDCCSVAVCNNGIPRGSLRLEAIIVAC